MTAKSQLITIRKSMTAHRSTPAEAYTTNDTITVDYHATFSLLVYPCLNKDSQINIWPLTVVAKLPFRSQKKIMSQKIFFSSKLRRVIFDDFMNMEPRWCEKPRIRKSVLKQNTGTPGHIFKIVHFLDRHLIQFFKYQQ